LRTSGNDPLPSQKQRELKKIEAKLVGQKKYEEENEIETEV
jgi:hypothetical protein